MENSFITLQALNEMSRLVKEKTDGKLDLDKFYLLIDNRYDWHNAVVVSQCKFIFFDKKESECLVVIAEFIEGRDLLQDSANIIGFDCRGYKDHDSFLSDISYHTRIEINTLRIIERYFSD